MMKVKKVLDTYQACKNKEVKQDLDLRLLKDCLQESWFSLVNENISSDEKATSIARIDSLQALIARTSFSIKAPFKGIECTCDECLDFLDYMDNFELMPACSSRGKILIH